MCLCSPQLDCKLITVKAFEYYCNISGVCMFFISIHGVLFSAPIHVIVHRNSSQLGQRDILRWRSKLSIQVEREQYSDRKQHTDSTISGMYLVRTGTATVRKGRKRKRTRQRGE